MDEILNYWFETVGKSGWYRQSDALDQEIRVRFEPVLVQITAGESASWRDEPRGRLAEVIVLDQFSRNMYRGTKAAFATDALALALAQEAVRCGADHALTQDERAFLYMPYMHSESKQVHQTAVKLFSATDNLSFELRHKEIIDLFGRYPHRNAILDRESTAEEIEWMKHNKGF